MVEQPIGRSPPDRGGWRALRAPVVGWIGLCCCACEPASVPTDPPRPAWIDLPAGSFEMGTPEGEIGRTDDEVLHSVTLTHPFRMGSAEVTEAEFTSRMGYNPSKAAGCDDCPVDMVNWSEAAAYANASSQATDVESCYACSGDGADVLCAPIDDPYSCSGWRLPTEAEWEYAARSAGTVVDAFPNGGDLPANQIDDCFDPIELVSGFTLDDQAWYCHNADHSTHPVGSREANPLGLVDMAGNVWEWMTDYYAPYEGGVVDPIGVGENRAKRGGSWVTPPQRLRVGCRERVEPDARFGTLGIRMVQTVE